ncbi:MAG: cytochrome c [Candidatus Binatia bacterium]
MARRWRSIRRRVLVGVLNVIVVTGSAYLCMAQDQDITDSGKREFERSCATCHGMDAKGNGPSAAALNVKPTDLTQLSKQHGGVFLFWRVYEKINGKDEAPIRMHGTREMPIWGDRFRIESLPDEEQRMGIRGRILSLVHYLESIQEK